MENTNRENIFVIEDFDFHSHYFHNSDQNERNGIEVAHVPLNNNHNQITNNQNSTINQSNISNEERNENNNQTLHQESILISATSKFKRNFFNLNVA